MKTKLLLILALVFQIAIAQQTGSAKVIITLDGLPVQGANVFLKNDDTKGNTTDFVEENFTEKPVESFVETDFVIPNPGRDVVFNLSYNF